MMLQATTKRPSRAVVPFNSNIHTPNNLSRTAKRKFRQSGQVTNMKYTYEISQWDINVGHYIIIFCDLDAEAFEQHSTMAYWWSTRHRTLMEYVSPARRNGRLHFNFFYGHPFMHPNALKYVFCAINRARHAKKIFLELPEDFILSVQVHQVLIFLQVEECIDPMHGHIRQIIRERPLLPMECGVLWSCLGASAPRIYEFALSMYYERQRHQWSLASWIKTPTPRFETVLSYTEGEASSEGDAMISSNAKLDIQIYPEDVSPCPDPNYHDTDDEVWETDEHELTTLTRPATAPSERPSTTNHHPSNIMFARRHSLPKPYFTPNIDTSAFRECEDEEPEY